MITKEELLSLMETASKAEGTTMPLYTKHINSTLFLSRFDEEEKERIQKILLRLNSESTDHAKIFKQLINQIKNGSADVY